MARKGNKKVRTGCLTCKARKVKCDEVKPYCNRCSNTGRKCDGYGSTRAKMASTPHDTHITRLPNYSRLAVGDAVEIHALQYFCEIAAPYMSSDANSFFWTRLVPQFCEFEPAVRHSVIAISLLYERLQESPARKGGCRDVMLPASRATIKHYNAAIQELKALDSRRKQPLVLLVCVLFVCIEFLQTNRDTAMQHFKHGALILENCKSYHAWVRDHMLPVFRHLSSFPFFFAVTDDDIPSLDALIIPPKRRFDSVDDAWDAMHEIFSRCLRLTRWSDKFRAEASRRPRLPKGSLFEEKKTINTMLDDWQRLFITLQSGLENSLKAQGKSIRCHDRQQLIMSAHSLAIRYEACRIIVDNALNFDEMNYDKHIPAFARIAELLHNLAILLRERARGNERQPKFVFDIAFTPILAMVLFKCRQIDIRLRVWRDLPDLMPALECLWNRDDTLLITKQLIEFEHGTLLDNEGNLMRPVAWTLPPEDYRIGHFWSEAKTTYRVENGVEVKREAMEFAYQGKSAEVLFTYK